MRSTSFLHLKIENYDEIYAYANIWLTSKTQSCHTNILCTKDKVMGWWMYVRYSYPSFHQNKSRAIIIYRMFSEEWKWLESLKTSWLAGLENSIESTSSVLSIFYSQNYQKRLINCRCDVSEKDTLIWHEVWLRNGHAKLGMFAQKVKKSV
jgi:hypothetical protein